MRACVEPSNSSKFVSHQLNLFKEWKIQGSKVDLKDLVVVEEYLFDVEKLSREPGKERFGAFQGLDEVKTGLLQLFDVVFTQILVLVEPILLPLLNQFLQLLLLLAGLDCLFIVFEEIGWLNVHYSDLPLRLQREGGEDHLLLSNGVLCQQ